MLSELNMECSILKNERYYYGIMPQLEREAYKIIYTGLKNRLYEIIVPSELVSAQIQEIYLRVLYDNPLFFFVNQTVIRIVGQSGFHILLPEYLYTSNQIVAINKDIRSIVNKVVVNAQKFAFDEFRLEKYLHDSIVKSVAYDYDSLKRTDCFNAHSIVGAFLDNKAVCEGIAKAFKLLCNEFGIKCIVVVGKANQEGDFNVNDYHAWNVVKIGKESYHVDVTWDNMYDKGLQHISYDYFNVTTEQIMLDHQPIVELPMCNSTRLNYFYCTNSFVSTYDELVTLIEQRFNSKSIMFKARKDQGEFQQLQELKEKTITAVMHAMFKTGLRKEFALVFNEIHNIGKIIFISNQKKIDLKKHN